MSKMFQIGTSEPNNVVGSRAAKATTLDDAHAECVNWSLQKGVKEAWLREYVDGKLGPVIATYIRGNRS